METNYEVKINDIIYNVDFEITGEGCVVHAAIEAFEDKPERECTQAEKLDIKLKLDTKFNNEIMEVKQFEQGNANYEHYCESADNFRG